MRDRGKELVAELKKMQKEFLPLDEEERHEYFNERRDEFNARLAGGLRHSALFIFLNKTSNANYRTNGNGKFNGAYNHLLNPGICDERTILADSKLLQNVEIMTGDFEQTFEKIEGNTFFYFDPPYRPLSNTSSFNSYAKEDFNDDAQVRLKLFCDKLNRHGVDFMLSNSDCLGKNGTDRFFDDLFIDYRIERVMASRNVNAIASKRGKLTEIVVGNY